MSAKLVCAVFDLPQELLLSLALKESTIVQTSPKSLPEIIPTTEDTKPTGSPAATSSTSCLLCNASTTNVQDQRQHSKSDWHKYNLKQKLRGQTPVGEAEFEKLIEELDESISGSGSDSSNSDSEADDHGTKEARLSTLLKKQAKISNELPAEEEESTTKRKTRGPGKPPLIWFTSRLLPSDTSLGIYRALFTNAEQEGPSLVEVLQRKQLRSDTQNAPVDGSNGVPLPAAMTSPSVFMCMVGGGHFAGMVVSLSPKLTKHAKGNDQRQAIVIAHKTFHRYTTRRKQGGGQSANDAAKGAAHSAGSSLRRYNEVALEQEIRALLTEWRSIIDKCQLIFVRATGSSNRRILFGPYEGQVLRHDDIRNRTFPFGTRRATQSELMRSFVELTRVKVSQVDEVALAAAATVAATAQAEADKEKAAARSKANSTAVRPSKEEEAAALHTNQIQALIRRSKVPALLQYLTVNAIPTDFHFHPPSVQANHHAPTPLHLAASNNSPPVVSALLVKAAVNPALPNTDGKVPFELAGDRATRDAFRVARSELGEPRWDWASARIPPPLSKEEAEKRDLREKAEAEKAEKERRMIEEEKVRREGPVVQDDTKARKFPGLKDMSVPKTAEEKRQEEARGMTPEMRTRLERERRARAAEARMKGV